MLTRLTVGLSPRGSVVPLSIVKVYELVLPLKILLKMTELNVNPDASMFELPVYVPSSVRVATGFGNVEVGDTTKLPAIVKLGFAPVVNMAPELFVSEPGL